MAFSASEAESQGVMRPMLRLALPVMAEQLLHLAVQYVDFYLTGNYLADTAYLAAMMLMLYASWFIVNLFSLVSVGATALVARLVGAKDYATASRATNQALLLGWIWALILMAIGLPLTDRIAAGMELEGLAADAAARYLHFELWVLLAICVERVGVACLRGAGDTVTGLVVMGIVNVINAVVSYCLLTGTGGLPEMGWEGLLIGTVAGHVCGAVLILALLIKGRAGLHVSLSGLRWRADLVRRLLKVGIPGGIDALSVVMCHLLFVRIINQLGELASAAHGVAVQIEAIAYMPGSAFQIAAATLAGQYLGARDPVRATRSVWHAAGMGVLIMGSASVVFYVAAVPLVEFFLDPNVHDPHVVELAAKLLRVVAMAMPPLALAMVLSGALRGAGDTRWPLLFTLCGFLLVRIPLTIFLAHENYQLWGILDIHGLGWGVIGGWYAMVADVVFRSILTVGRFVQGGWKQISV